jgi:hypothetical protein
MDSREGATTGKYGRLMQNEVRDRPDHLFLREFTVQSTGRLSFPYHTHTNHVDFFLVQYNMCGIVECLQDFPQTLVGNASNKGFLLEDWKIL